MKKLIYNCINSPFGGTLSAPFIQEPIRSGDLYIRTGRRGRVDTLEKLHLRFGRYERHERMLVRKWFREDLDTLDLGASIGVISCEILRRLKNHKVVGVEADPDLCSIAEQNIRLNFPDCEAEMINASITEDGARDSFVQFGRPLSGNLGGHVLGTLEGHSSIISVPALPFSDVVRRLNGAKFQMACDIEGSEIPLFIHSADAFRDCELMMIELHHSSYQGVAYTPAQEEAIITKNLAMNKVYQKGSVCIFARGPREE
jgi:FkbM family methyltransferase